MKKFAFGAAAAALALAMPAVAPAQQLPPAVIAVVDTQRIYAQCTACVAANQQLQAQRQQLEQRAQQLAAPLQTEQNALATAVNALPQGQQPDAVLTQRITTFQTQQENARRELQGREQTIQRNAAFVVQQINQRLEPIVTQVMQQRGATIAVDRGATLAINSTLDVTDAVLALLNQQLPSVSVNAPAQQPPPAQQQQQPQQQRPRPQGR